MDKENNKELNLFNSQKLDALTQTVRSAAHDLNNCFAVIVSSVELATAILRDENNPRLSKALNNIKSSVDRGTNILRVLRSVAYKENLIVSTVDVKDYSSKIRELLVKILRGDLAEAEIISDNLGKIEVCVEQLDFTLMNLAFALKDNLKLGSSISFEVSSQEHNNQVCFTLKEVNTNQNSKLRSNAHRGPGWAQAAAQATLFIAQTNAGILVEEGLVKLVFPQKS